MPHCSSLLSVRLPLFPEVTKTTVKLFRSLTQKQEPPQRAKEEFCWMRMTPTLFSMLQLEQASEEP
jgi:hypothetical protein